MSDVRDLDYGEYLVEWDVPYIETENEMFHLRTHLGVGENVIQFGPKGIGKTMSFEKVAAEQDIPLIIHSCSKDTKKNELMTQSTMSVDTNGNRVVEQIPGAIPKGIYSANEYGKSILLFEEISCLPAGTMIRTPRGEVPIEEISNGDLVVSTDLNRLTINRVVDTFDGYNSDVYRVTTTNGRQISITGEHQIWTDSGWIEAQYIEQGARVRGDWDRTQLPIGGVGGRDSPLEIGSSGTVLSERVAKTNVTVPMWDEVGTVEEIDGQTVYNITVSGDHNYFANDILVHNSLSPNLQKLVNRVADNTESIELEKAGEVLRLDSSADLMVGGTMNPSSLTGGAFELNDDLKSRFTEMKRSFPKDRKFKQILKANGVESKIGEHSGVRDDIVSLVNQLRNLHSQGEVSYSYSPRDSVRFGKMWKEYYTRRLTQNDSGMNETQQSLRDVIDACVMGKYSDENGSKLSRKRFLMSLVSVSDL